MEKVLLAIYAKLLLSAGAVRRSGAGKQAASDQDERSQHEVEERGLHALALSRQGLT